MCPFAIEVPTTALELFSVAFAALVEASALLPAAFAAFILAAAASWLALAETEAGRRARTVAWRIVSWGFHWLSGYWDCCDGCRRSLSPLFYGKSDKSLPHKEK